jgi:undecaprenyl diphosphate synthase
VGKSEGNIPRHIAIIMDGNGRWAQQRKRPRIFGHHAGRKTVRKIVEHCAKIGVDSLTLFAFSTENWRRPDEEVGGLMRLFMTALKKETRDLDRNNIRLQIIGDVAVFSDALRAEIERAQTTTHANTGMQLNIAANYGGRADIVLAVNAALQAGKSDNITEADIAQHIALSAQQEPDLFIRTGGERRISNFLLWQLAYTELYFTDVYWPDFTPEQLDRAIAYYAKRERRFGQTGEQVAGV